MLHCSMSANGNPTMSAVSTRVFIIAFLHKGSYFREILTAGLYKLSHAHNSTFYASKCQSEFLSNSP